MPSRINNQQRLRAQEPLEDDVVSPTEFKAASFEVYYVKSIYGLVTTAKPQHVAGLSALHMRSITKFCN